MVMAGLLMGGCTSLPGLSGLQQKAPFRNDQMSMQDATGAIVPGSTDRPGARAVLGHATEIVFDSGYEVWLYRGRTSAMQRDGSEFLVLFDPSGFVKKTRIRPWYVKQ